MFEVKNGMEFKYMCNTKVKVFEIWILQIFKCFMISF